MAPDEMKNLGFEDDDKSSKVQDSSAVTETSEGNKNRP